MSSNIILGREIFEKPLNFHINTCSYEIYEDILTHQHSFIELNYVSNGCGIHLINDKRYDVSKGDFYLIPPGADHVFLPYDLQNTKKLTTINCIFYPEFLFEENALPFSLHFLQEIKEFCSSLLKGADSKTDLLRFQDSTEKTIEKILKRMLNEYHSESFGNIEIIKMNLYELLIHMKRYSEAQTTPKDFTSYTTEQLIHTAITYLEENCLNPVTLEEVCNYVMLSKCYFCTQFKRVTGKSVIRYLQEIRMKKASELLLKSNYSITTISQMVGYSDYNFFTQTYKKITGTTPRQYRKHNQP